MVANKNNEVCVNTQFEEQIAHQHLHFFRLHLLTRAVSLSVSAEFTARILKDWTEPFLMVSYIDDGF